jgi:hypothetical protein
MGEPVQRFWLPFYRYRTSLSMMARRWFHISTEPLLWRFDLEKNIVVYDSVVFSTCLMG